MQAEFQIKQSQNDDANCVGSSFKGQALIIKNLQHLITSEICLQLSEFSANVHERLKATYQQIFVQLKLDLRRVEKTKWERVQNAEQITQLQNKIRKNLNKIVKLKEINIYFNALEKQQTNLQADVQKFMCYEPKSQNLSEKLQRFFSEPTISELFLKEYENSFNPNNFSADLIDFFYFLHSHGLLVIPPCEQYAAVRNKDLIQIENTTIIFRQICDISDKYTHVEQLLADAYIHLKFIGNVNAQTWAGKTKQKQEEVVIQQKISVLVNICNKIKYLNGNFRPHGAEATTIVLPEEPEIFEGISQEFEYPIVARNEQFLVFLQELYNPSTHGESLGASAPHLDFLRTKIIKADTRWHLNRIISAFNVGSHVINQVHGSISPRPNVYTFDTPSHFAKYEFKASRLRVYSSRSAEQSELFILNKNTTVVAKDEGYMLKIEKDKVIYPSAIHNYYYFLKYLLCLSCILKQKNLYSEELMLALIEIKADEMAQWAEIALNLYDIVKNKYYRCYQVLQEYLTLIFQVKYKLELDSLTRETKEGEGGLSQLLAYFAGKQKKAGWISQIIFQFDSDHDIHEPLLKLCQIERQHKTTFYCWEHAFFFETILNQIIETRNNLKFDKCYSSSALHQLFGFMAARPGNMQELAAQLTPLSKTRLRLPDLLKFYSAQTRLKRAVFNAEVYWISIAKTSVKNKFIIGSMKKRISFKDFLQENAKNLLNLTDKPLCYFITNLEQFERSVLLFSQQVDRLKYIQCSLNLLRPDFALEDHLSGFSYKQLVTFFHFAADFNLVEDCFVRRDKKNWLLATIKRLIESGNKLKFSELPIDPSLVCLRRQLAGFIFFIFSFEQHYCEQDCIKLITKIIRKGQPSEYHMKLQILRSKRDILKLYDECQCMDAQALLELTQIYEFLILLAVQHVLRRSEVTSADARVFNNILRSIPTYESFRALQYLIEIETMKRCLGTSSNAHILSSLKLIMKQYKQRREEFKNYSKIWDAEGYMCGMIQISLISRRLFCNEIIELKRQTSREEWRTHNKSVCLSKMREILDRQFINSVNRIVQERFKGEGKLIGDSTLNESINFVQEMYRKQIIAQYDEKYLIQDVKRKEIVLFDEFRGYEVEVPNDGDDIHDNYLRLTTKKRTHYKKGILNTGKHQSEGTAAIIDELQHRVNLEIVKQSLPIRKMIYRLQLQQKKIRDEISWETCKLQHNVISQINKFIEESNLDQKQSLINFKYTVNLETIKGIEKVIHERTQIFTKTSKMKLEQGNGFVTELNHEAISHPTEQSLLEVNVKNIFAHMKKLKIFWAWKNISKKPQGTDNEWAKFSENTEKILHNNENIARMQRLHHLRSNCLQQQILCNLIKEQNGLLNSTTRNIKLSHLTQKLNSFKEKYRQEGKDEQ